MERTDTRASVWIAFDRGPLPAGFDGPLAAVTVAGDPSDYLITCRIDSGS